MRGKDICEFCNGTGWVSNLEFDADTHTFVPCGLIECKHPNDYDDYSVAPEQNRS